MNAIVPATATNTLPSDVLEEMERSTGTGLSTAQRDNLIPLAMILHKLSPQTDSADTRYIPGAQGGDIWLRGAPIELVKGNQGMIFQPVHFYADWGEWVPRDRGGGFVARYPATNTDDSGEPICPVADVTITQDTRVAIKKKFTRPNGNEVIYTKNHVGFVIHNNEAWPFIIPMVSTNLTVSREWMTLMNRRRSPQGKRLDSLFGLYKLTTKQRTNQLGTWFTWQVQDAGYVSTREEIERGRALLSAFTSGERVAAQPEQQFHETEDATTDRSATAEERPF